MSWHRDPQLFLQYKNNYSVFRVFRVNQELSVGTNLRSSDFTDVENYSFSKHFSLGNNKESDYDVFLSYLKERPNYQFMNSQGLVATYDGRGSYLLSRQVPNSPIYSLPSDIKPAVKDEKNAALEKKVSDLETTLKDKETQVSYLQQQLQRERAERETQEKQISELTSKLEESCGVGGESIHKEAWMTGHPVPSNWVSYDDLDVQAFPKDNHLNITKVPGTQKFGEDNTTNVQSSRFCRGVFPIVVVNVAELTPNQDDARFDPQVWSLYKNQGTTYAARKPFESEMSAETQKTR